MIEVTDQQVTEAIHAVVLDAGEDYIYPARNPEQPAQCLYVWNGEADCIVGRVLKRLGATIPDLLKCDKIGTLNDEVLDMVGITMSYQAGQALREAQRVQDNRYPWGKALTAYERTMQAVAV